MAAEGRRTSWNTQPEKHTKDQKGNGHADNSNLTTIEKPKVTKNKHRKNMLHGGPSDDDDNACIMQ